MYHKTVKYLKKVKPDEKSFMINIRGVFEKSKFDINHPEEKIGYFQSLFTQITMSKEQFDRYIGDAIRDWAQREGKLVENGYEWQIMNVKQLEIWLDVRPRGKKIERARRLYEEVENESKIEDEKTGEVVEAEEEVGAFEVPSPKIEVKRTKGKRRGTSHRKSAGADW